jgi:hypothetical protein
MTAITATTGSTGGMDGVHIKDATKNRIALFNDQKRATQQYQTAQIQYTITVSANSHHLLFNVSPSTIFSVSDGSTTVATPTSTADGVLEFEDNTNSSGEFIYTITEGATPSMGFTIRGGIID